MLSVTAVIGFLRSVQLCNLYFCLLQINKRFFFICGTSLYFLYSAFFLPHLIVFLESESSVRLRLLDCSVERCVTAAGGLLRSSCTALQTEQLQLPSRSRVGSSEEEEEEGEEDSSYCSRPRGKAAWVVCTAEEEASQAASFSLPPPAQPTLSSAALPQSAR